MKKIYKLFFLLIFLFPCFVSASINYSDGVKFANSYLEKEYSVHNYKRYFNYGNNIPFIYDDGRLSIDNNFKNGGFISRTEFNLTFKEGLNTSYLNNGLDYWVNSSMINSNSLNYCILDFNLQAKNKNVYKTGIKVSEYVINAVKVTGDGTYHKPYVFSEGYMVAIGSKKPQYGTVVNPLQYVASEKNVEIAYTLTPGYRYIGNNCDDSSLVKYSNENKFIIYKVSNDINCYLDFDSNIYDIYLDSNGGSASIPDKLYARYLDDAYLNRNGSELSNKIEKLNSIPVKNGYIFKGFYTGETQIINNGGVISKNLYKTAYEDVYKNNKKVFEESAGTNNVIATANYDPIQFKVSYDANGGNINASNTIVTCTYDQDCLVSNYGNNITRSGYTFLGWSENNESTSVQYMPGVNIKNITSVNNKEIKLYAVWKKNSLVVKYHYNNGISNSVITKEYSYDSDLVIAENTFAGTSTHTFDVWNSEAAGNGISYKPGNVANDLRDSGLEEINLYAQWDKHMTINLKIDNKEYKQKQTEPNSCKSHPNICTWHKDNDILDSYYDGKNIYIKKINTKFTDYEAGVLTNTYVFVYLNNDILYSDLPGKSDSKTIDKIYPTLNSNNVFLLDTAFGAHAYTKVTLTLEVEVEIAIKNANNMNK